MTHAAPHPFPVIEAHLGPETAVLRQSCGRGYISCQGRTMRETERTPTTDAAPLAGQSSDAARWQKVRDDGAARRGESRQARRHAAEIRGDGGAILDAVALMISAVLRRQG